MSLAKIRTGGSLEKHLVVKERIQRMEPGLATLFKSSFGLAKTQQLREHTTLGGDEGRRS